MDQIVKGMTQAGQQAKAGIKPPGLPRNRTSSEPLNAKGAMREPSQTPGQAQGELEEVKRALHELEEEKGDWSKGGG